MDLITTCVYNTMDRSKFTFVNFLFEFNIFKFNKLILNKAGESTKEEMCYNFILYYPRDQEITYCGSSPDFEEYYSFFNLLNQYNKIISIFLLVYNIIFLKNRTGDVLMPPFKNSTYRYSDMIETFYELGNRDKIKDSVKEQFQVFFNSSKYMDNNFVSIMYFKKN